MLELVEQGQLEGEDGAEREAAGRFQATAAYCCWGNASPSEAFVRRLRRL